MSNSTGTQQAGTKFFVANMKYEFTEDDVKEWFSVSSNSLRKIDCVHVSLIYHTDVNIHYTTAIRRSPECPHCLGQRWQITRLWLCGNGHTRGHRKCPQICRCHEQHRYNDGMEKCEFTRTRRKASPPSKQ